MKRGVIYIIVCVLFLTGCNKTKSDDIKQDISAIEEVSHSQTDAISEIIEDIDIPEALNYTIMETDGINSVEVDAIVEAEGYGAANVYNETPLEIDSEYIMAFAEEIFDDGSYEIVKPYDCMNDDELAAEIYYWNDELDKAGDREENYDTEGIGDYLLSTLENLSILNDNEEKCENDGISWHITYEDELGVYEKTEVKLRGRIDGDIYELIYEKWDDSDDVLFMLTAPLYEKNIYGYTNDDNRYTWYGENKVDREAAKNEADDLIYKLGYEDMVLAREADIQMSDVSLNGYKFKYVKKIDGISLIDTGSDTRIDIYDKLCRQEYLCVYVNEYGVSSVYFVSDYERGDMKADNAAMLTFEQIDEVAREYIRSYVDSGQFYHKINQVKFGYISVCYGESYALVPAWVYQYYDDNNDMYYFEFGVNAIDGSLIDMEPSQYNY